MASQASIRKIALIVFLCLSACSTTSDELNLVHDEPLSFDELTAAMPSTFPSQRPEQRDSKLSKMKACIKVVNRIGGTLSTLKKYLAKKPAANENLPFLLANLTPAHCSGPSFENTLQLTERGIHEHSGRIGVILPLSGAYEDLGRSALQGIKAAQSRLKTLSGPTIETQELVIRDSTSSPQGAIEALADLVFHNEVALIIGGLSKDEALAMAAYANGLLTPMLILNKDKSVIANFPYALQVYPNENDLAQTLARASHARGFRKIAILKPNDGKADLICASFKNSLRQYHIELSQELTYQSGDYDSMNASIIALAHTAPEMQAETYRKLLLEAQQKADAAGLPFDARSVVLPAKVQVDAVFLPDHFRMVRYFSKLLKYHGVESLPLIGTHEWRARELVDPWDDFMEGSIFADFIGSYSQLPPGIKVRTQSSPYFVSTEQAPHIDFQIIGYRAAQISLEVMATPFLKKRFILKQLLRHSSQDSFFTDKQIFYGDRSSHWPTFLFAVRNQGIELIEEK